jgi:peptide/nickel transport system permease protein
MQWIQRIRQLPYLSLSYLFLILCFALFAEWIAPGNPNLQNLREAQMPPSADHLLGTDQLGRDILSRIIFGARISIVVGIAAVAVAAVIGVFLGVTSVMVPRWLGDAIMRLTDIFLALPAVLIALAVAATVGPSLINVILIIGLVYWAQFARLVRGEALSVREREYVLAARVTGSPVLRIIRRHILPNVANTIIVMITLQLASAILLESILSFLGIGIPPPTPSWGNMVADGRPYIAFSWWIVTLPGLAIMLTVFSVNLCGDWLRDRLDPKLRTTQF